MNFHFQSLGRQPEFWFSGSAPAEMLLSVVEEITFYSTDMSFPPTPFLSDTQPHTAATVETQPRIKCNLGSFWKKVFEISTALTSVTSVWGVSPDQIARNTLKITFHTYIFWHCAHWSNTSFIHGRCVWCRADWCHRYISIALYC